ncbi:photosynthetic complex assembly protein PuhC [Alexandriicola marinus]|uniref:photosynthetic complex assembly protein PuhC n=1 Tax=Alexandriicola marinus TaxID=2081710 RepID=UPI001EEE8D28|nr:photosynthetic complex assembly protein PuhC [Alexandriicola marinus]
MVPRILVQAMFGLMIASVALVAFAQLTDRPQVGVLIEAPIVQERSIHLSGDRTGNYVATDALTGEVLVNSAQNKNGFVGVIGRVMDRERMLHNVSSSEPFRIVLRDNGHIAIIDDSTDNVIELIGYGADNVASFARLMN